MRACIINPLQKIFFEGKVYEIEPVNGLFGGFCDCGGVMTQKGWVGNWLMIPECESCWKLEAFLYENYRFVERFEIPLVDLEDFLREILTPLEFEAIVQKVNGQSYNYTTFSRAKKKMEEMNLVLDEIIEALRA